MTDSRPRPPLAPRARIALAAALLGLGACADAADRGEPVATATTAATTASDTGYRFSEDWFSGNIPVWEEVLAPYRGRPGLRYLEVGLFEGRSALWMLDNVLTDPGARLTGIDLFPSDDLLQRWLDNLERSGHADKATTLRGYSQVELRNLAEDSYDIIYVDGSHTADDVMADAVLSWPLLREGGLLIFDDYAWAGYAERDVPGRRPLPADLRPAMAIDAFLTAYRNALDVVHRDYQLIVRKRVNPCPPAGKYHCVPVGDYNYLWRSRVVYAPASGERLSLSEAELDLLERFLETIEVGQTAPEAPPALRADPAFRALAARLGIALDRPAP